MTGLIYYVGLIDWLQQYTARKWIETKLKGLKWDASKISCVPARLYAERMLDFIGDYTM